MFLKEIAKHTGFQMVQAVFVSRCQIKRLIAMAVNIGTVTDPIQNQPFGFRMLFGKLNQ